MFDWFMSYCKQSIFIPITQAKHILTPDHGFWDVCKRDILTQRMKLVVFQIIQLNFPFYRYCQSNEIVRVSCSGNYFLKVVINLLNEKWHKKTTYLSVYSKKRCPSAFLNGVKCIETYGVYVVKLYNIIYRKTQLYLYLLYSKVTYQLS